MAEAINWWEKNRQWAIPLILVLGGLILILTGWLFGEKKAAVPGGEIRVTQNSVLFASVSGEKITVDISGAVLNPGVYRIPNDSRIGEALITAGGLAADADREYLSKYINLAQRLSDGQKIFIPSVGSQISNSSRGGEPLISLNSGSEAQLDSLPGVGPATVQKIISGRPYARVEDLLTRKIVGPAVFEKIKSQIGVN